MFQSRKHHLFARLLNLACKEDLVQNRIDLSSNQSQPSVLSPRNVRISPILCLTSPTHLVPTYLIEVEHQIQLTHIPKELIQHFNEEMYRFQIRQLIIIRVYARAEE